MSNPLELSGPGLAPAAGGDPRQLVVMLHGYGADGEDLITLAPDWARLLPHAAFVAPHAPFPCESAPFGRQWFGLYDRDAETVYAGLQAAAAILDDFLDARLREYGLGDKSLALVGFSQGTMLALQVALRRANPVAGVIGFSGMLLGPERLGAELRSRPPVLLIHGDADTMIPVAAMQAAAAVLTAAGVAVTTHRRPGLPHGIDQGGLLLATRFLQQVLATEKPAATAK